VSFLRRTEYISTGAKHRAEAASPFRASAGNAQKRPEKRKTSPEPDAGTPAFVKRKIERSFEVAQANLQDRSGRVRHPTKRNLRLVSAYQMLPDLDAFPDSGAYVTVKFSSNPVSSSSVYDRRLESGIFVPIQRSAAEEAAFEAAMEAHELNPLDNPRPANGMNYHYFLPDSQAAADGFRAKFDLDNPDRDDDALYTSRSGGGDDDDDQQQGNGTGVFHFNRVRTYETAEEKELAHDTKYTDEIILAFDDARAAVLYYPVMQRSTVRSQRQKNIARTIGFAPPADEEDDVVDRLDVTVADPTDEMLEHVAKIKADPLHFHEEEDEAEPRAGGAGDEDDDDDDAAVAAQLNGDSPPAHNGRGQGDSDADADADGYDEEE